MNLLNTLRTIILSKLFMILFFHPSIQAQPSSEELNTVFKNQVELDGTKSEQQNTWDIWRDRADNTPGKHTYYHLTNTFNRILHAGHNYNSYVYSKSDIERYKNDSVARWRFVRNSKGHYKISDRGHYGTLTMCHGELRHANGPAPDCTDEWKLELVSPDTYKILNVSSNRYLYAGDNRAYGIFAGPQGGLPNGAIWKMEISEAGVFGAGLNKKVKLINVKMGEPVLDESKTVLLQKATLSNETYWNGTFVADASFNYSNSISLKTETSVTNTVAQSHTVAASIQWKSGAIFAGARKTLSYEYTNTTTSSKTEANGKTTETKDSITTGSQVRMDVNPSSNIEVRVVGKRNVENIPYTATAIMEYDDGHRETIQGISGIIETVLITDISFRTIDQNNSLAYPHHLGLDDALLKNGWSSVEQIWELSHDELRNTLIHRLYNNSMDSLEFLQGKTDEELVGIALTHKWAIKTLSISQAESYIFTAKEKRDQLIIFSAMHGGSSLKSLVKMSDKMLAQKIWLQWNFSLSPDKFDVTGDLIDSYDVLAYLGVRTVEELKDYSADTVRNTLIVWLSLKSSASIESLAGKTDKELIAHALVYEVNASNGMDVNWLADAPLDHQRNGIVYFLYHDDRNELTIYQLSALTNYELVQMYYDPARI